MILLSGKQTWPKIVRESELMPGLVFFFLLLQLLLTTDHRRRLMTGPLHLPSCRRANRYEGCERPKIYTTSLELSRWYIPATFFD